MLLIISGQLGCVGLTGAAPEPTGEDSAILVFAAASLRDALLEAGSVFEAGHGVQVDFSFAGSNVLARQIEAAPVADVFFSASVDWVERLDAKGLLADPDTKADTLSRRLRGRMGDKDPSAAGAKRSRESG